MDFKYKLIIIIVFSILFLYRGVKNVYKNRHNTKTKAFFSSIDDIVSGIAGTTIFILFFTLENKFIFVFIMWLILFFWWLFWIIFKKRLNNSLSLRMDISFFIGWIIILLYVLSEIIDYPKF